MELRLESCEQDPTIVDISTLRMGNRFTVIGFNKAPENEKYEYIGYRLTPRGRMHEFKTVRSYPIQEIYEHGYHWVQKPKIWEITGNLNVIRIQNSA